MKALEEIKARLEVANLPPLQVWVTENLRWADIVPASDSDNTQRFARCADDDQAELFANAPADMAKLIAALEAVDGLHVRWDAEEFYNDSEGGSRSTIVYYCGTCVDGNEVPSAWPCPTIAAIAEALA